MPGEVTTLTDFGTGLEYSVEIKPNSFYPTLESMFSIFLGLQNKSSIESGGIYSAPTVKVPVLKYLMVTYFLVFTSVGRCTHSLSSKLRKHSRFLRTSTDFKIGWVRWPTLF